MAKNLGTVNTHPVERRVGKDIAAMYKRRSGATINNLTYCSYAFYELCFNRPRPAENTDQESFWVKKYVMPGNAIRFNQGQKEDPTHQHHVSTEARLLLIQMNPGARQYRIVFQISTRNSVVQTGTDGSKLLPKACSSHFLPKNHRWVGISLRELSLWHGRIAGDRVARATCIVELN